MTRTRMEWQPIETAPGDGTPVLGWVAANDPKPFEKAGVMYVTWSRKGSWIFLDTTAHGGARYHWEPTHWMPLPEPPA
jgi:hypothetical protein